MNTKLEILQYATKLFLKKGYTSAYVTTITKGLDISTGNLTFHFPTKEHILAELVKEMCEFQRDTEENNATIQAYLTELAIIASVCNKNKHIRDLIIAAYTHSLPLEIIRKNDYKRAMKAFGEYCTDWEEIDFIQAENIASGIEYSIFMMSNTQLLTFEQRITSSLDAIMKVYDVPKKIRENIINNVLNTDYESKGNSLFEEFCNYVDYKLANGL